MGSAPATVNLPLWSVAALRDELCRGLSPGQSLPYLVMAVVLCGLPQLFPSSTLPWPIATNIALLAVAIVGIVAAYLRNGSSAGVRFIERVVAVSVVIAFRYTLLVAVPGVLLLYFLIALTWGPGIEATVLDSFVVVVVTSGYFERVAHHVGQVARAPSDPGVAERQATA